MLGHDVSLAMSGLGLGSLDLEHLCTCSANLVMLVGTMGPNLPPPHRPFSPTKERRLSRTHWALDYVSNGLLSGHKVCPIFRKAAEPHRLHRCVHRCRLNGLTPQLPQPLTLLLA
jgi:hypothetical protein